MPRITGFVFIMLRRIDEKERLKIKPDAEFQTVIGLYHQTDVGRGRRARRRVIVAPLHVGWPTQAYRTGARSLPAS